MQFHPCSVHAAGGSRIGLLMFSLLTLLFPVPAATPAKPGSEVSIDLSFSESDLDFSVEDGFDIIRLKHEDGWLSGEPGEPLLPVVNVKVLLPDGTRAVGVEEVVDSEMPLTGKFRIYPAQPLSRSSDPVAPPWADPDPAIYSLSSPWPASAATVGASGVMRGYSLAAILVRPVAFVPADGRLLLRKSIRLRIRIEPQPARTRLRYMHEDALFEQTVRSMVVNPKALDGFRKETVTKTLGNPNVVQYLIVTSTTSQSAFQPLADWKTKKGIRAEIVTVEDEVYPVYPGATDQQKIKACIQDYVLNHGTVWVLLGGDSSNSAGAYIIPDQDCYGNVLGKIDATIPTDLYYSAIDDLDWNDDNDAFPCEIEADGDTIDLFPDVFIGRIPARTAADVTTVVSKILAYEKNPPMSNYAENLLLAGKHRSDLPPSTGPSDSHCQTEAMFSASIQPFWTGVQRDRLYDTGADFCDTSDCGPDNTDHGVTPEHLSAALNLGYNMMFMASHGDHELWWVEPEPDGQTHPDRFEADLALALTNAGRYTNVATMACVTAEFDTDSTVWPYCLGEAFLFSPSGGAVSYVGFSRNGFSSHGNCSIDGESGFVFLGAYYRSLLSGNPPGRIQHIGAALFGAKNLLAGICGPYGAGRWMLFGLNLLGDPELCVYTTDPHTFSLTHYNEIAMGPQTFYVETHVAGALVCLQKDDEVYAYGNADADGYFVATINPVTAGTMYVTVSAPNYRPEESMVDIPAIWTNSGCYGAPLLQPGEVLAIGPDMAADTLSYVTIPPCVAPVEPECDTWYRIAPGLDEAVHISLTPTISTAGFLVYSGKCGAQTLVGCSQTSGLEKVLDFVTDANEGLDYYIRCYAVESTTGGDLVADWDADNDECAGATKVANGSSTLFGPALNGATLSAASWPACIGSVSPNRDIWYRINPGLNQYVKVDLAGEATESGFVVYSGSCGSLQPVGCGVWDSEFVSLGFYTDLTQATSYYIRLYAASGTPVEGAINVNWQGGHLECARAKPLGNESEVDLAVDLSGATFSGEEILDCVPGFTPLADTWYVIHPGLYQEVTIQTTSDQPYTGFRVYTGSCGSLQPLCCPSHDDGYREMSYTFVTDQSAERDYYIQLYSVNPYPVGEMTVQWVSASNDEAVGAISLSNGDARMYSPDLTSSTLSPEEMPPCVAPFVPSTDVWYACNPGPNRAVHVETNSTAPGVGFVVYEKIGCAPATVIECSTVESSLAACDFVTVDLPGHVYWIRLWADSKLLAGEISVSWRNRADECSFAYALPHNGRRSLEADMVDVTPSLEAYPPCAAGNPSPRDVWYRISPSLSRQVTLTLHSSVSDSGFVVYSGSCGALVPMWCSQGDGMDESLVFNTNPPTLPPPYLVRVYSRSASIPEGEFHAVWVQPNGECGGAIALANHTARDQGIDSADCTLSDEPVPSCFSPNPNWSDYWYCITPGPSKTVNLVIHPDTAEPYFAVYSGSCQALSLVGCSVKDSPEPGKASYTFNTGETDSGTYFIRVFNTVPGATGGSLQVDWITANNECAGAKTLDSGDEVFFGDDLADGATVSALAYPPCKGSVTPTADVWYRIHPGPGQHVLLDLHGDLPKAGFVVYSGVCDNLSLVDCSHLDPLNDEHCSLDFYTAAGYDGDYFIRAYGIWPVATGGILRVDWPPRLPGQSYDFAMPAQDGDILVTDSDLFGYGTTLPGYSDDVGPCSNDSGFTGHWIDVIVPAHSALTVTAADSDLSGRTAISFYQGTGQTFISCQTTPGDEGQQPLSFTYSNTSGYGMLVKVLVNHLSGSAIWQIDIDVESLPVPTNNEKAGAAPIGCGYEETGFITTAATPSTSPIGDPCSYGNIPDVWFEYTTPEGYPDPVANWGYGPRLTITFEDDSYYGLPPSSDSHLGFIALYEDQGGESLRLVDYRCGRMGGIFSMSVDCAPLVTYFIRVGSTSPSPDKTLSLDCFSKLQ